MLYVELKRLVSWEFGQQECQLGGRQWWYHSKGFRSEQRFYWKLGFSLFTPKSYKESGCILPTRGQLG